MRSGADDLPTPRPPRTGTPTNERKVRSPTHGTPPQTPAHQPRPAKITPAPNPVGSTPRHEVIFPRSPREGLIDGRLPERPMGADCKSVGVAYPGSNPGSATAVRTTPGTAETRPGGHLLCLILLQRPPTLIKVCGTGVGQPEARFQYSYRGVRVRAVGSVDAAPCVESRTNRTESVSGLAAVAGSNTLDGPQLCPDSPGRTSRQQSTRKAVP